MNVISYCRISSDEQSNHSLPYQNEAISRYCTFKEYTIVKTYLEDASAKNFNRPEWKKVMEYIKQNKGKVSKIICLRYDRFSRNFEDSLSIISQLGRMGVEIEMVESNVEMNSPESLLTRNIMLTLPEIENIKIGLRSREGSYKCRLTGGWTGKALKGYKNVRVDTLSTMTFSDEAPLIQEAFERLASGKFGVDEVRRWLNSKGMKITKNHMPNIIKNITYCGKIVVPEFKGEPQKIVNGRHPALISEELFAAANEAYSGRRRNMRFHDDKSDLYPLKGYLVCPEHGRSLSAYASKGRKELYHYYVCTKPGNHCPRYPIGWAHNQIESILSKIQFTASAIGAYKKVLDKVFSVEDNERKSLARSMELEIEKLRNRRTFLSEEFMSQRISGSSFEELKREVDSQIYHQQTKLNELLEMTTPYKHYLNEQIPMLEDLVGYYRKSDGKTKKKILGCIFSEKVYFDEKKDANYKFTQPIEIMFNVYKGLEDSKKEKQVGRDLFSVVAPLILESCNQNELIQYAIIRKLSG